MKKNNILNVQPQSLEGEQAVLGSMLSSKTAVDEAMEILRPEHFYKDAHSKIYSTMLRLSNDNEPVDTISVVNRLKKSKELEGVGGAYYITGLIESSPTAANVVSHSHIVLEKAMLRQLILLSHEVASQSYDDRDNAGKIITYAEEVLFQIASSKDAFSNARTLSEVLLDSVAKVDLIHSDRDMAMGVPSGITHLDQLTLGFHNGEFNILAGRPGMGKSAFMLSISQYAAAKGKKIAIFTLEMSDESLVDRVLFSEAEVDSHKARGGFLSKDEQAKVYKTASRIYGRYRLFTINVL